MAQHAYPRYRGDHPQYDDPRYGQRHPAEAQGDARRDWPYDPSVMDERNGGARPWHEENHGSPYSRHDWRGYDEGPYAGSQERSWYDRRADFDRGRVMGRSQPSRFYRPWDDERGTAWTTYSGQSALGPRSPDGSANPYDYGDRGYEDELAAGRERAWNRFALGTPRGGLEGTAYGRYGRDDLGLEGSHRGRGPKGYQRTDERIHDDVCEAITRDPYIDATDMAVRVKDGVVTLEGEAPSRQMKHRAEDCADSCSGVKDVENHLRVSPPEASASRTASPSAQGTTRRPKQ